MDDDQIFGVRQTRVMEKALWKHGEKQTSAIPKR